MLLGIPLEEAIQLVGVRGLTVTRQIREGLAKAGVILGPRLHPKKYREGQLYLARLRMKSWWKTHWVIIDEAGDCFDPADGMNPTEVYEQYNVYVSSLYEVGKSTPG